MSKKILNKLILESFPLKWVNLNYFPGSQGEKVEIYLRKKEPVPKELISMFYILFGEIKQDLKIHNNSWWDFCLDTWNYKEDKYDYELENKTKESKNYLIMLQESNIEKGYSGICNCENWEDFLLIILKCILTHQAPFSPIFYNEKDDFFFYFHHSGSIGFLYNSENEIILKILNTAKEEEYELR